jgi:hypothetical protein
MSESLNNTARHGVEPLAGPTPTPDTANARWGDEARRRLAAAREARTIDDAISETQQALAALYLSVDERPTVVLDVADYAATAIEERPACICICPPGLVERGGYRGGCLVHGSGIERRTDRG